MKEKLRTKKKNQRHNSSMSSANNADGGFEMPNASLNPPDKSRSALGMYQNGPAPASRNIGRAHGSHSPKGGHAKTYDTRDNDNDYQSYF